MTEAFARLKSGSDIRGVAFSELGRPATLTEDIGSAVGVAFARWLAARSGKPATELVIAAGRDSRVTGELLQTAITRGIESEGATVLDCGLATTPAMFMSTLLLHTDGAVMVTASHLPWQRNGYKFFTAEGGLEGGDITAILDAASGIAPVMGDTRAVPVALMGAYAEFLRERVYAVLGREKPLAGLHVVVDAGNGSGGFYADMLDSLGANVTGSQFLTPDGEFPGHVPNPEDAEAMRSVSAATVRAGADLGVIFDADCDRAAMVNGDGQAINRNRLIALVTAMLLEMSPGITVVTDSVVSAGLDTFISGHGGRLHRFKRGYRNVIDEAKRLNAEGVDCPLAMETSGHAALRENHFLDDGMYLMTRLIVEAQRLSREGRQLISLIDGLQEPIEEAEVRLPIQAEDFRAVGQGIVADVEKAAEADVGQSVDSENREGVRIQYGSPENWLLLRLSVHDPLIVINAESAQTGGVSSMLRTLRKVLANHTALDLTALDAQIN